MIDALFDLPELYLTGILAEWVGIADIGRLDSACCLHRQRDYFLSIVSSDPFIAASMVLIFSSKLTNYFEWHTKRRVKFLRFEMGGGFEYLHEHVPTLRVFFETLGGPHVQSINLVGDRLVNTHDHDVSVLFDLIATHCQKISCLYVESCLLKGVEAVLRSSHDTLKDIQLDFSSSEEIEEQALSGLHLPNVHSLGFFEMFGPTLFLESLIAASSSLTYVSMFNIVMDRTFVQKLSQRAGALRELVIQDSSIPFDIEFFQFTQRCTALQKLHLSGHSPPHNHPQYRYNATARLIALVRHCPLLTDICVDGFASNVVLEVIAAYCGSRLRLLSINNNYTFDSDGLDAFARACRHLVSLQLHQCIGALQQRKAAFARLIQAQTSLTDVSLPNQDIDNDILDAIATHGAHLTSLNLRLATGYTPERLTRLMERCVALKTVVFCSAAWRGLSFGPVDPEEDLLRARLEAEREAALCQWRVLAPKTKFLVD